MGLTRSGVNLGFVERPLFAGFLWGILTGDMTVALPLAVFYELFWLDLFPAGTYLPPNGLFPMLTVVALAGTLPSPDISTLFLPVILTLPLAFLGSYLEKRQRKWQVAGYTRLLRAFRSGRDLEGPAGQAVAVSLLQLFALNFAAFLCAATLVAAASEQFAAWQGQPLTFAHATWPLLWIIGCVGGVMSLRIRRSYVIFAAGSVCVGLMALWGISF